MFVRVCSSASKDLSLLLSLSLSRSLFLADDEHSIHGWGQEVGCANAECIGFANAECTSTVHSTERLCGVVNSTQLCSLVTRARTCIHTSANTNSHMPVRLTRTCTYTQDQHRSLLLLLQTCRTGFQTAGTKCPKFDRASAPE